MKLGFKRTISWYKYRPEITIQPKKKKKKKKKDCLIDPIFRNICSLFALSLWCVLHVISRNQRF